MGLEQIKLLLKVRGMSVKDLSEESGVSESTLNKILNGYTTNPRYKAILAISHALSLTLDELIEVLDYKLDKNAPEPDPKGIIERYYKLSQHSQGLVDTVIDYELNSGNTEKKPKKHSVKQPGPSEERTDFVNIPVYYLGAAAGTGQFLETDFNDYEFMAFPNEAIPEDCSFGIKVNGNSMEPTYSNEDIVFVKQQQTLESGEIGIFILNDEGYIKELKKSNYSTYLHSHNPRYPDIRINEYDDLRVVGKVLGKLQGTDNSTL